MTGVQTCALPISENLRNLEGRDAELARLNGALEKLRAQIGQVGKELVERPKNKYQANSYCILGLHKYWCNEKRDGKIIVHFAVLASSKTQEANKKREIRRGY